MADPTRNTPELAVLMESQSPAWATLSERVAETRSFQPVSLPLYQYTLKDVSIPPLIQFTETTKATLTHVDTSTTLLGRNVDLYRGIFDGLVAPAKPDGLTQRLRAFFGKWAKEPKTADPDVAALLAELKVEHAGPSLTRSMIDALSALPPTVTASDLTETAGSETAGLLALSRRGMDDFHAIDGLAAALQRLKRRKMEQMNASLKRSARLEIDIAAARAAYANLDRTRLAAEEDYNLARGLLAEQLQAVDDAFAERQRLLSNPVALCYVRVNDLPVRIDHRSAPLIPSVNPGQLPVACDSAAEPPARLTPFLELLADQPMSAWRALAGHWHRLPSDWVYQPPLPVLPGYATMIQAMPIAFRALGNAMPAPMAQRVQTLSPSVTAGAPPSQAVLARRAADRITLEQLTGVRSAALRITARRLQDDLSRALACLLQQLAALPAADRFAWSRLAEDDQLPVERPASWPGFDVHRRSSAGLNLRLVIEWLYAQLADAAPTEARAALRTSIRACLLQAVNDDPAELLVGDVVQFPGLWKPGVLLGTTLNRTPTLQAPLKVYDAQHRLIGEARVVDSQPPAASSVTAITQVQAQVEIVTTYVATPLSFAGWTLVG